MSRNNSVRNLARFCLLLVLPLHCTGSYGQEEERVRIRAKHIYTVSGEVISPGEVLIKDGNISFVGESIDLGLPATELEVDTLVPGMIDLASSVGISGGEAEVSREITPDFSTLKAIDWRSREFDEALDQGVTTLQILPSTESVFGGYSCVVKTAGDNQVVDAERSVLVAVCSDPTSRNRSRSRPDSIYVRQPTNRMGVVWIIRNALHQAQNGGSIAGVDPQTQGVLESIVQGKTPVLAVSRMDYDIRSALALGEPYGIVPTILGGDEVYRMIDEFKSSGAPLVYTASAFDSSPNSLRGQERSELRWNVPGLLHKAEVTFCLGGGNLLDRAQFAVRFGLPRSEALKTITLYPAKILGLEESLGSIEVGKQADLVAFSGDPLQPTSRIAWTMVGGKIYGNNEE